MDLGWTNPLVLVGSYFCLKIGASRSDGSASKIVAAQPNSSLSASEVTALWRYTNLFIIIIFYYYYISHISSVVLQRNIIGRVLGWIKITVIRNGLSWVASDIWWVRLGLVVTN